MSAAGKVQRPQFAALLDAVRAGLVDVLVAWALDRLCRTARDRLALVEACRDAGVMIALVRGSDMDPTTPAGRLALGILGEVAQHEIDQKSDRQRRAVQQRAEAGLPATFTPAPFGWLDDRVTEHPLHGPALRAAAEHVLSGGSLRSVARQWEGAGLVTPQTGGTAWIPSVIRSASGRAVIPCEFARQMHHRSELRLEPARLTAGRALTCSEVIVERLTSAWSSPPALARRVDRTGKLSNTMLGRHLPRAPGWVSAGPAARPVVTAPWSPSARAEQPPPAPLGPRHQSGAELRLSPR